MIMQSKLESLDTTFWAVEALRLSWDKPFTEVKDVSFTSPVHIRWFSDGELNVCYNCVDRHLPAKANHTALIWEGDNPQDSQKITYQQLYENVCRFSNVLKKLGVQQGDRVTLYLPMIPEAVYAMLACARLGAVHSVVFGGFSPEALAGRIEDCGSKVVITADEGRRAGKTVSLKANVDKALEHLTTVETVLVIEHTGCALNDWVDGRDVAYKDIVATVDTDCPCVPMNAEAPLFLLYTSGSTGKPKGVLHTTGGYLVYAAYTHEQVFDYKQGDVYWCTADVGWITGHTYTVYGALANGATTLIFEGVPTYPDASRCWQIIDKYQVNIFYTAPTAIRALMREGNDYLNTTSRKSLRVLGSVGEPINPEAWHWYNEKVGLKQCAVVDTWWQTETGGILISPRAAHITTPKAGSATQPLPTIQPVILDNDGKALEGEAEGNLCLADSWPAQARTLYRDHARFEQTYFSNFTGYYFSGDGCRRDSDGDYWITGRVDDVINVAGHRLGTAEIEAILDEAEEVVEAAVVGFPHDVKGQGIYAFVILHKEYAPSETLKKALIAQVREHLSPIATPDKIQFCSGLPKTRSGKIMRRILRKIAAGETDSLGDISTLADPSVVEEIIAGR
jgi:acetyl-CoA synthetase